MLASVGHELKTANEPIVALDLIQAVNVESKKYAWPNRAEPDLSASKAIYTQQQIWGKTQMGEIIRVVWSTECGHIVMIWRPTQAAHS